MVKNYILWFLALLSLNLFAQDSIEQSNNDIDFDIIIEKDHFQCTFHQNVSGDKFDKCSICNNELARDKKVRFYFNNKSINIYEISGRVIIVFKDGTQVSRKLKFNESYVWIKLNDYNSRNYQQALLKFKYQNKKYNFTFGEPLEIHGHHH